MGFTRVLITTLHLSLHFLFSAVRKRLVLSVITLCETLYLPQRTGRQHFRRDKMMAIFLNDNRSFG